MTLQELLVTIDDDLPLLIECCTIFSDGSYISSALDCYKTDFLQSPRYAEYRKHLNCKVIRLSEGEWEDYSTCLAIQVENLKE